MKKNETEQNSSSDLYFSSPQVAISIITKLLRNENFKTLAKYYDLSSSDIPLSELESGDFFIRRERPEMSHPGGFWRYKHPFSPGFSYHSSCPGTRDNVFVITVSISIEQGIDSPTQEGLSLFYMIKSTMGWQILPDQVSEDSKPEIFEQ